jgi:hypothetical protein
MQLTYQNKTIELNDALFWDVPIEKVQADTHKRLIITRVLTRGNLFEFSSIFQLYGKDTIIDCALSSISLSPKTVKLLSDLFQIDQVNFTSFHITEPRIQQFLF